MYLWPSMAPKYAALYRIELRQRPIRKLFYTLFDLLLRADDLAQHVVEEFLVNSLVVRPLVKLAQQFPLVVTGNLHLVKRLNDQFPRTTARTGRVGLAHEF